jgi:hypothetical protein
MMSGTALGGITAAVFHANGQTIRNEASVVREILFIDPAVPDFAALAGGVRAAVRPVLLDARRDALEQIADALERGAGYDTVHVVTHGAPGRLEFCSGVLSHANLSRHADALARIGAALAPDAELLLWACAAGQGAAGRVLIDALTEATGANVAAATRAVGDAARGGSWTLDAAHAPLAAVPFTPETIANYRGLLPVNSAPVFANLGEGAHPQFTENGSSVVLDGNVTVSDAELNAAGNYGGATLTLARHGGSNPDDTFAGTGTLDLTDVNGNGENVSLNHGATFIGTFTQPGDGTFSITFNAAATAANVAAVMQQITYANASDNPQASVQIDWSFGDGNTGSQGSGGVGIATGSVTVDVAQVDDAPVLVGVAVAAAYAPGSPGVTLSPALGVFDPDAASPSPNVGLASANVSIAAGFLAGDELFVHLGASAGHFVTPDGETTNISVQNNVQGVLTLSGVDTVAHYQAILDAVSYHSTAADPSNSGADTTRRITWKVNDGVLDSHTPAPETLLHIDTAPAVDLDASGTGTGFTTAYRKTAAPIAIADTDVSITSSGTSNIDSATIVLTNAKAGDSLSIAGALPDGIDGTIDTSVAGQVTVHLVNTASLADYQTAIGQIRFGNSSNAPDNSDRDIKVSVSDDGIDSNAAHATVHVIIGNGTPGHDFSGDGKSDILLRSDAGTVVTWDMNDAQVTSTNPIGSSPANWNIAGTGDFNGDHKSDILWRSDSGTVVSWDMNDGQVTSTNVISSSPVNWNVVGTGDFNGDGKADILWRSDAGTVVSWDMNDGQVTSTNLISSSPANWKVAGVGDFNNDGKSDILWRSDAGTVVSWDMNDGQVTSTNVISTSPANWQVAATGDYNGDGKADILWRSDAGTVVSWDMNDAQVTSTNVISTIPADWHII